MRTCGLLLALYFGFLHGSSARAEVKMDEATRQATAKALEWLASQQNPTDGSWSDGAYSHNTAITAFAMLAFMSQGHLPNQGFYGPEVAKAARFLMASAQDRIVTTPTGKKMEVGYLVGARGGNMYCHAMATLALTELWGQMGDLPIRDKKKDKSLKEVVTQAVDLIIHTQNDRGGWRYQPEPSGADISVTIMQVMALRAANNAGLFVPDATRRKAIDYIKSCYNPQVGGFSYMPGGSNPGFARTAAGACVLFLVRNPKPRDKWEIETEAWMEKNLPRAVDYLKGHFESPSHFWYGHYYAVHAMHQWGSKEWEDKHELQVKAGGPVRPKSPKQEWEEWYGRLVKHFVTEGKVKQGPEGSWTGRREVGPVYQTSIAVIALSTPLNYLPIFQR